MFEVYPITSLSYSFLTTFFLVELASAVSVLALSDGLLDWALALGFVGRAFGGLLIELELAELSGDTRLFLREVGGDDIKSFSGGDFLGLWSSGLSFAMGLLPFICTFSGFFGCFGFSFGSRGFVGEDLMLPPRAKPPAKP